MLLGDMVEQALAIAGVTPERVGAWLQNGGICGSCQDRRDKLNALHLWARRTVVGKAGDAKRFLEDMLGW